MVAAILWREDIDRDECVVGEEAGFENRRGAVVDQFAGEFDALSMRIVGNIDEHAAREAIAGEGADLPALVEAVLKNLVRLELKGERLVDFPPQELVALGAGGVARLREAVRHTHNLDMRCDIATDVVRALKRRF